MQQLWIQARKNIIDNIIYNKKKLFTSLKIFYKKSPL